jgi:hypothetical protein
MMAVVIWSGLRASARFSVQIPTRSTEEPDRNF